MRLLLLSDTHGNLSTIEHLARDTDADAVIHAGDFGFYDKESSGRLSERELRLHVLHSGLPDEVKKQAHRMGLAELRHLVESEAPLSDLSGYMEGTRSFSMPVYAVWGNHEDKRVVEGLLAGTSKVKNLQILSPDAPHRVGPFLLYGLGGNVLVSRKLFDRPLAGGAGKIWATLSQIGALLDAAESTTTEPGEVRVLVTHVSPGKEPLVERLGAYLDAHFLISGHMGSPYCAVWNEFAIREPEEAEMWLNRDNDRIRKAWEKASDRIRDTEERRLVERALSLLADLPGEPVRRSRGRLEPPWYRRSFTVNLPDADQGHALFIHDGERVSLATYSAGRRYPAK